MPIGKQFTGSLESGQYWEWYTWGWPREWFVQWSVRPSAGHVGMVSLRALAVEESPDGTLTYHLTVWNVGPSTVQFDAFYDFEEIPSPIYLHPAEVIDNSLIQRLKAT